MRMKLTARIFEEMRHGMCLLVIGMVLLLLASAQAMAQGERILSFDSRIEVREDASLVVTETITVQAAGREIKRGIYRDFPQLYRGRWGLNQRTGFDVLDVRRDGKPEKFHLESRDNGQRVYIGQSNVFLEPGEYTYELTYQTDRQLGFFRDHDELYWNVTGNGWSFSMDQVTAAVTLPPGAEVISSEAYTGAQGSRGRDYASELLGSNEITFETTRRLGPKEGLTIVVAWPKGFVEAASPRDQWMNLLYDNEGVAIALGGLLLVLIYYFMVWMAVGKDPAPGTIIPLYGPPRGFSPAACRNLVEMGFDHKAFAANLIDLAVKGAITIEQAADKTYTVHRKNSTTGLLPDENALYDKLLGARQSLPLEQTYYKTLQSAVNSLKASLALKLEKTYFRTNFWYWFWGLMYSLVPFAISLLTYRDQSNTWGMMIWLAIWTLGVTVLLSMVFSLWRGRQWGQAVFMTVFSLPFVGGEIFGLWALSQSTSVWVPVLFLVGALMNGVFYHLMKAPTAAGRKLLDQIDGFRRYLTVAEKDRLNLENPPQRTPELFEMFLPYALALNVEQEWAEQFEDVLAKAGTGQEGGYSPSWYHGTAWSTLGATGFAASLGSSMSSAISSSSTAPGSSSGGGGGGSSGGGGGGGGGGGW
ncbi:MAG: DUF2207 domain-containing protein [Desulfobacteraceae bacterium]|nr:MAG: DUF2207 domain-containing protein [Desulfobacteraceae bacterium]